MADSSNREERLRRRAQRLLDRVDETPQRLASAVAEARAELDQIHRDERLSPEAKAEDADRVRMGLDGRIDKIELRARDAAEQVERSVETATRLRQDRTEDLIAEQRLSRAWARTKPLLEAGHDAAQIAQDAVAAGDRDTIAALRQELGAFMRARSEAAYVSGTMAEIEAAAAALDSPAEAAAREVRGEIERARRDAATAISWARHDGVDATEIPRRDGLLHLDA
jgi:hypothetical protein